MDKREFHFTEKHMLLLNHAYIGWQDCETGAPEIDPKRPYGNSYVAGDVAEIIGIDLELGERGYECLSEDQEACCLNLHRETQYALQILIQHGPVFGHYVRSGQYGSKWVRDLTRR